MRLKQKVDEYFFGETPGLLDALLFYGVITICAVMTLFLGVLSVI